jgi:hypothetical protein
MSNKSIAVAALVLLLGLGGFLYFTRDNPEDNVTAGESIVTPVGGFDAPPEAFDNIGK